MENKGIYYDYVLNSGYANQECMEKGHKWSFSAFSNIAYEWHCSTCDERKTGYIKIEEIKSEIEWVKESAI